MSFGKMLSLFKNSGSDERASVIEQPAPENASESNANAAEAELSGSDELIAVISAAVAVCTGGEALAIRSITQVSDARPTRAYRPWNTAAILENHRGLY